MALHTKNDDSYIASSIIINEEFKPNLDEKNIVKKIQKDKINFPKQEMSTLNKQVQSPQWGAFQNNNLMPQLFAY